MLPIAIIAGGLATRLYPVTQTIPKSLIEISGRPFIDHQLSLLKERGVTKVILCVGNLGNVIESYVGDGSRWDIDIQYSYDGRSLLGTGGAIKKALDLLPDDFLILYGDSYLDIDIEQVVQRYYSLNIPVLMTVFRNRNAFDKSNIVVKNHRVTRYNKEIQDPDMEYIDYGLIALRKSVFDPYPVNTPFDLAIVLSHMVELGYVGAFEVDMRFYEIGSAQGIREAEEYIRNRTLS